MDGDSEALQRQVLELLQALIPDAHLANAEAADRAQESCTELPFQEGDALPLDAFNSDSLLDASPEALGSRSVEVTSSPSQYLLNFGEISVVQDRFYALLKRRLESEIQQNPPLFPWESEVHDYEVDLASYGVLNTELASERDSSTIAQPVPALLWINQLKAFNLPVALPEAVLAHLLERCQQTIHASLQEGVKLVRAVEDLFPGQSQALNHLAGLVVASPARSGALSTPSEANYPASYESAMPSQQMVLSLLAAREIIGALSLTVSSVQPIVERQWLTELGLLTLHVEYEFAQIGSRLRIQGRLPCGGRLLLRGHGLQAEAQRPDSGTVSVELFDLQLNQPYVLDVQFLEQDHTPLIFSVCAAEV